MYLCRTPIVNKKQKKIVESNDDEEDTNSPKVKYGKKGQELAPCGRPSFAANPVNKKYNSRYRNPENKNKLGGKLLDLGKATGIVAVTLFGFDVSFEASNSGDRLRIFKSAAWYALTDEEVEEVLEHTDDQVDDYLKGLVTAGIRLWRYEAPEEARRVFQNEVFAPLVENPIFQTHLALSPGQRVQSQ
jgi:hypothetical protein